MDLMLDIIFSRVLPPGTDNKVGSADRVVWFVLLCFIGSVGGFGFKSIISYK
jgi:hypothetical protein